MSTSVPMQASPPEETPHADGGWPVPESHTVQFYPDEDSLVRSLSRYVGMALGGGDAAIVIATRTHRDAIEERIAAQGLNLSVLREQNRYFALDAARTLAKLLVDAEPNRTKLEQIIVDIVTKIPKESETGGERRIVAFGEMVALLCAQGKNASAIELERLWNDVSAKHRFEMRCAYPLNGFYREDDQQFFVDVCAQHTEVVSGDTEPNPADRAVRLKTIAALQDKVRALEAESALKVSEEKFKLLVSSVRDYAIFILDPDGNVISWNAGAERIKGYTAAEILGRNFSAFFPPEAQAAHKPDAELRIAAAEGRFEEEGWRVRKDGSRFLANVVITALRDAGGNLLGFAKVTRDVTERVLAAKKIEESEKSLHRLSGQLLRIQDEERKRLGRELHDSVGQYLAALKMNLDALRANAVGKEGPRELEESLNLLDQCIREVRTISYLLYPPMLEELGLKSAVPWYVEGFGKRSGMQINLYIQPELDRFSRDVELAIFRVLQESLTNVHRHSGSLVAHVRLELKDGHVIIEVGDQGKGISKEILDGVAQGVGNLGVGFRGMDERIKQLGGRLEIQSNGGGTTVRAAVPIAGMSS